MSNRCQDIRNIASIIKSAGFSFIKDPGRKLGKKFFLLLMLGES